MKLTYEFNLTVMVSCFLYKEVFVEGFFKTRYIGKKVSLSLHCVVQHSVIMANFMMPETHQPIIVIILIIYSVYLSKGPCRTLGIYFK